MSEKIFVADKATLDKVYNILAPDAVWGFIEHNDILSPTERIEYTGINKNYKPVSLNKETGAMSLNDWAGHPILEANKPYMVRKDGTPDYRLDPDDYTKKEDGTESDVKKTDYEGGAFSWLQKIYKQEYMTGNDRHVNFSMTPRDGFKPVGFVDMDGAELEGVWLPMFYGSVLKGETETPVMTSLSDLQPDYNKNTETQKKAIDNFSKRAVFLGGPVVETIIDLLILFAKTADLQNAYGNGNMNGYDTSQTGTNGVKMNAVVKGGQFYGTSDGKSLNKIFHSIVLGSWQQWMRDPYEVVVNGRVKVSTDYKYDLTGGTYLDTGIQVPDNMSWDGNHNASDYPSYYRTVPGYGAIPAGDMKGGTSATGGCDGLWRKDPKQQFTAVALRFGYCDYGAFGGPRARSWYSAAGYAVWWLGAAVLLFPPVGVAA